MPKVLYVTRVYEVALPDDHRGIEMSVDEMNGPEDARIIKSSDEALAMHLSYQYDMGNFTDIVDILDTSVSDVPPDVEEFTEEDLDPRV